MKAASKEDFGLTGFAEIVEQALAAERDGYPELTFEAWASLTAGYADDETALIKLAEELSAANPAASESLLSHMVRIYPRHLLTTLKWMETALRRGDVAETLRRGVLARQRFPNSSFGYVLAGLALRDSGRAVEADSLLAQAAELFPGDEGAAIHWANNAARRGASEEADRRLAVFRERFPKSVFGYVRGSETLRAVGKTDEADALLTEAIERFPTEQKLHLDWTTSAINRRDWEAAIQRGALSRQRFPDSPHGVMAMYQALNATGKADAADAVIEEALQQFPGEPAVLVSWTDAASQARNWTAVQDRATKLIERFPDHNAGYFFSGLALRQEKKTAEALAILEEGRRRFPSDLALLNQTLDCLAALHRLKDAVALLDYALTLRPRDAGFMNRRIQLMMNLGDHAGALAAWRRVKSDRTAERKLSLELAWTIYKVDPTGEGAVELLTHLVTEEDAGGRGWQPWVAEIVLLRLVRPDLMAFAREALPGIEAGPHTDVTLQVLKSALLIDYTDADILHFLKTYVAAGRTALTAHLFSQTYIHQKPEATQAIRAVFDDYIEQWLAAATPEQFQNHTEILGYLNFAAVFSHQKFRRLATASAQHLDLEALRADGTLHTPDSIIGRIVPLAVNVESPPPNAAIFNRNRRLKIAVCVSGQLRGYDRAFPTWGRLGLEAHDAQYFVHTWRNIGRNWFRFWTFTQKRELLWETLRYPDSIPLLKPRYPTMTEVCSGQSTSDVAQLQEFYRTPHVVLEDDEVPPISKMGTPWKMHRKIELAHELAVGTGEEFDLYIRIRPDREVVEGSNPDWHAVFEESKSERLIYSDRQLEYGIRKCTFGDQFAAGCREVMDIYSTTFSATEAFLGRGEVPLDLPAALDNHGSMAYRTFYNAVLSKTVPDLTFGHLFDPVSISPAALVPYIEADMSTRPIDEFDKEFLAACREMVR